jgi:predicted CXXCH cytochrome family protein
MSDCPGETIDTEQGCATPSFWKSFKVIFGGIALMGLLLACATIKRTSMVPPQIPGATFVGSKTCEECHEDITKGFPTATHARLMTEGAGASEIGCESCHGPGSIHNQSGGEDHTIINPGKSPDVCFQCHLDKRGEFNLPHRHPVIEGKMSCTDCHDPHKGHASTMLTSMHSQSDNCAKCHTAQHGPFVFEHEAIREGCTTCHAVHGSVNQKMLLQRNAALCLKCHFQQQTAPGRILIGGRDHSSFLGRGTCWTAGCHEAVHGSQIGSSLRF